MPMCFVTTPLGVKHVSSYIGGDREIDFDSIYKSVIRPAVENAGFECCRIDEVRSGIIIMRAQFECIMNSHVMIADITGLNPNVIYEVGLRHGLTAHSTVIIYNQGLIRIPFDLNHIWLFPYLVEGKQPTSDEAQRICGELTSILKDVHSETKKYGSPLFELFPGLRVQRPKIPCVFIGHGRSRLWRAVQNFVEKELRLKVLTYEADARAGLSIVSVLETMVEEASFAILIHTAEDEMADSSRRARQNVVHEAGLFQGSLGFRKAILLVQKGVEAYSNVAGLQHLEFEGDRIDNTFFELERALKREGLLKPKDSS